MLKLYDFFRSSACFRVRITLALKKLSYDTITVHLVNQEQRRPGYLNLNPQGLVPMLESGDHHITQSMAIIEYLEEMYPTPPILPKHPYERALARAFAFSITADIHPLVTSRAVNHLKTAYAFTENQALEWMKHWIHLGLEALEKQIRMQALAGDFCYGNQPTIADVCLIPQLYHARRFACDLTDYPQLRRIEENCQKHSAFMQAWPLESVT